MDWVDHPAYVPAREARLERRAGSVFQFQHLRPVVFLCGKHQSEGRDRLAEYIRRHRPEVFVFYAEHVWEHVSALGEVNALALEDELARLADAVIILVESPGTFAELGAFTLNDHLRPKLLPILDRRFQDDTSFINTGPVAWISKDSRFRPPIFTNLEAVLISAAEVNRRLDKIPRRGPLPRADSELQKADRSKHVLFFLCDLLAIVGPATPAHCEYFLKKVFGRSSRWTVTSLLGLAVSLGLIASFEHERWGRYYYRVDQDGSFESFQRADLIEIPLERMRIQAVYQKLPDVMVLMREFNRRRANA